MDTTSGSYTEAEVFFETPDFPSPHPHTLLYPLEPYGIGTGYCESIISYIFRLADAHRLSPTTLIKEGLSTQLVNQSHFWANSRAYKLKEISRFITPGKFAEGLISVLKEATGTNYLEYCTMLPIHHIISARDLFSTSERHCSMCLKDTSKVNNHYGRLLWEIACVKACPIHKIQLITSSCGAPKEGHLKLHQRKLLAGVCSRCGSIGYQCKEEPPINATRIDIWKSTQVAELISYFPISSKIFSDKTLISGLSALVSSTGDGMPALLARKAGIYKSLFWGWLHGINRPNLGHLLQLCLIANVSLVSLLKGQPVECICPPPDMTLPKKQLIKPSIIERKIALKKSLTIEPPQSLSAIATTLGITAKLLRNNFPELSKQVVERYHQFGLSQTIERDKQIREIGQRALDNLNANGLPVTLRNFQRVVGKALLPESRLRKFFIEAKST